MECRETGQHTTIRVSHLSLGDVQDLDRLVGAIKTYGSGNGDVTVFVVNNSVCDIAFGGRLKRTPRKVHLQRVS